MSLPGEMLALAVSLVSRDGATGAECWAALHLAYYALYHVSKGRLEGSHSGALAGAIRSSLVRRGKTFDDRRVDSLDPKYLRKLKINMHQMIPLTLYGLGRQDLQKAFNVFRCMRNRAAYNPRWKPDLPKIRETIRDIGNLAEAIRVI